MIRWIIGLIVFLTLVITVISFYLSPNSLSGCGDKPDGSPQCSKVDAIVAISGGDTTTRTEKAIQLFKNGWGDRLVLAGAAKDTSGPSNAKAMKNQAEAEGVPADKIDIDEQSSTTSQNALDVKTILSDHSAQSMILVTSGYHQRRAYLEFQSQLGPEFKILNAPTDDVDWNFWWWTTPRGWWLAGSELVKIAAFYMGQH